MFWEPTLNITFLVVWMKMASIGSEEVVLLGGMPLEK